MAKFRAIRNCFTGGEVSPSGLARTDLPSYQHSCKILRNAIPLLSGGAYRRPGTFFESSDTHSGRVIPFVVSKTESYAIVLNNNLGCSGFRPTDNKTVSGAVTFSPSAHPWKSASSASADYDEIHDVQYVQSGDIMYLVHPNRKPQAIVRTAVSTFYIVDFDSGASGTTFRDLYPYRAQNTSAITLACSATTVGSGRTLTASAAFFDVNHVGAVFKIDHAGTIGCMKVTGYTSSTQVTVDVVVALGSTGAVATWWESAWSNYRGWPRTVCFHQQRLGYGGNASQRDTIWWSATANYSQFSVSTITDPNSSPSGSQPFSLTFSSEQLNLIQWLSSDVTLLCGTLGEEWIVDRIIATSGFECGNVAATRSTRYGSAYRPALRVANEVIFELSTQQEIRSLVFNQLQNSYQADPIQLFYDEFPKIAPNRTNQERAYRCFSWDESRKTVWAVDTAGNLVGLTRDRTLQIGAWHSHQLGGYDSTDAPGSGNDPAEWACSGSVISLTLVPNPITGFNDLWLIVKRKISGSFVYHLERMIGGVHPYSTAYQALNIFVTGGYMTDASAYSANDYPSPEDYVFGGTLTHLEGKTVIGTMSGAGSKGIFTARCTGAVSSGMATLTHTPPDYTTVAYGVALGLEFDAIIEPVRPEVGSQIGTAQGATKRIHEVEARFYNTMCAKIGRDANNLEEIQFREGDTPMGKSAELFTGDKRVKLAGDYDRDGYIYVLSDKPLPFMLVGLEIEGVTYD